MLSSTPDGSGRHRGAAQTPLATLAGLWRRPHHRSALKGLGLAASALGVATAFAAPAPSPAFQLAAATTQPPLVARAEAASAPEPVPSYGVIGFQAQAAPKPRPKPKPKASSDEPKTSRASTAERSPARVSRGANYSRAGLGPLSGMSQNAVAVVNEVKASFPSITSIGGYRAGDPGDHGSGHAVDIMCSGSTGDAVAAHLQGMAGTLGIKYIIWEQRIWYPGGGWEGMSDRGSATANHYDHVHVSVN